MGRFLTEAWIEILSLWRLPTGRPGRFLTEAWIEMVITRAALSVREGSLPHGSVD